MSTTTTNFSLIKPGINDPTDQDLWGGYLNGDLDSIDNILKGWLYTSISGVTTVTAADAKKFYAADATGGGYNVTLPSGVPGGFSVTVKKIDASSNGVTIVGTIDGATNLILTTQYDSVQLVYTGTAWFTLSRYSGTDKTGIIEVFGGAAANIPSNFLLCDGAAVSRTTYAKLFTRIGTLWGAGNGTTTFNVPLLNNGYFLRGYSIDSTVDPSGPRAVGTSQTDAFQGHTHTVNVSGSSTSGTFALFRNNALDGAAGGYVQVPATDGTNGTPRTARETRPVNKTVCYVINV